MTEEPQNPKKETDFSNQLKRAQNQRPKPYGAAEAGKEIARTGVGGARKIVQRGTTAASAGATTGSVIPIVGTALGAGAGFIAGSLLGASEQAAESAGRVGLRLARGQRQPTMAGRAAGAAAGLAKEAIMTAVATGVGAMALLVFGILIIGLVIGWFMSNSSGVVKGSAKAAGGAGAAGAVLFGP